MNFHPSTSGLHPTARTVRRCFIAGSLLCFISTAVGPGARSDISGIATVAVNAVVQPQEATGRDVQMNPLRDKQEVAENDVKPASQPRAVDFAGTVRPILENYCLDCHTGDDAEAGMDLARFESSEVAITDLSAWGRVLEAIESNYMPPVESDQPTGRERSLVERWVRDTVAEHSRLTTTPMRRFNRIEYENSVSDLLKFNRDVFLNPTEVLLSKEYFRPESGKMPRYVLAISHYSYGHRRRPSLPGVSNPPSDPPVEHGFSNDYRSLSTSPLLMEQYFEIANSIVNDPGFPRACGLWEELFVVDESLTLEEKLDAARQRLAVFLPRAFRRPVESAELETCLRRFESSLRDGATYTDATKSAVSAILVSPNFLFRDDFSESISGSTHHREYSMACRLSYFLWGTMPDDELFRLAELGSLQDPDVLRSQVQRMLKDFRIKSLSTDFGTQWLKIQKVNSAMPDKDKFPRYYRSELPTPGVSMMIEQLLLFETILVEDRSIMDFITADFAYLNRDLMDWYQIKPSEILGFTPHRENYEDFFRIKWPNLHRGGIVTSGAMLVSTSATTRTSPVYRGSWLLDVVFNRPPPPPPADVPALDIVKDGHALPLNVREKLEQHRRDPVCAGCHDRLDPLGYPLEKFDAVGQWRKNYENGDVIDSTGQLFGVDFEGPARFKKQIARNPSRFVRGFVEHLMEYALGRPLTIADLPEIERITSEVIDRDCRFSEAITQIVLSKQFQAAAN